MEESINAPKRMKKGREEPGALPLTDVRRGIEFCPFFITPCAWNYGPSAMNRDGANPYFGRLRWSTVRIGAASGCYGLASMGGGAPYLMAQAKKKKTGGGLGLWSVLHQKQ